MVQARSNGTEVQTEYELTGQQTRSFEIRIVPEKDENSTIKSILLIGREITERKQIEKQLRYLAEFEKLISTLATNLINSDYRKMDTLIVNALRLLGKFLAMTGSLWCFSTPKNRALNMFLNGIIRQ